MSRVRQAARTDQARTGDGALVEENHRLNLTMAVPRCIELRAYQAPLLDGLTSATNLDPFLGLSMVRRSFPMTPTRECGVE